MLKFKSFDFSAVYFVCLQLALLIGFYWEFLSGQKQFFLRDNANFFEPLSRFIGDSLKQGQLPLWNPYSYCGMSELAVTSPGIFYPLNLLFAVFPYSTAVAWIMILSQLTCGLGAFMLVKSLRWGTAAAAVAGFTMSFSGYMFSLSGNFSIVAAASWFPLLIWSIRTSGSHNDKTASWKSLRNSAILFMMVSAGRPEIWLPGTIIATSFCLYQCLAETTKQERADMLFFYFRSMIIGFLFAMPAILPALEWLPLSRRTGGLASSEVLMFSASWYDFLCMIASQPLGDLLLKMSPYQHLVDTSTLGRFLGSCFISSLSFTLAMMGLEEAAGKQRSLLLKLTLAFAVLISIVCMGSNIPFADTLVKFVPGASILRFPTKLLYFLSFPIAILAARGIRNYNDGSVKPLKFIIIWAIALAASIALNFMDQQVCLPFNNTGPESSFAIQAQKLIAASVHTWSLYAFLLVALMWFLQKQGQKALAAGIAAISCGLALYLSAASFYRTGAGPDYYSPRSLIADKMKEDDGFLRYAPLFYQGFTIPPSYISRDQLESTLAAGTYSRQVLNGFSNIDFQIPSTHGYEGAMPGEFFYLLMGTYSRSSQFLQTTPTTPAEQSTEIKQSDIPLARMLQLCACKFALTQCWRDLGTRAAEVPHLDSQFFDLYHEDKALNLRIYKLKTTMPHAYLSYSWQRLPDFETAINTIYDADQTGFDPARVSLITDEAEDAKEEKVESNREIEPLPFAPRNPNEISIEANAKESALLVLADQYYPGWKAELDGQEAEILRCNAFMRAVRLPAGKHSVTFKYAPTSLINGLLLALVAMLWQLLHFVALARRAKQEHPPQAAGDNETI